MNESQLVRFVSAVRNDSTLCSDVQRFVEGLGRPSIHAVVSRSMLLHGKKKKEKRCEEMTADSCVATGSNRKLRRRTNSVRIQQLERENCFP